MWQDIKIAHSSCKRSFCQSFHTFSKPHNSDNPTQTWKPTFSQKSWNKAEEGTLLGLLNITITRVSAWTACNKETHSSMIWMHFSSFWTVPLKMCWNLNVCPVNSVSPFWYLALSVYDCSKAVKKIRKPPTKSPASNLAHSPSWLLLPLTQQSLKVFPPPLSICYSAPSLAGRLMVTFPQNRSQSLINVTLVGYRGFQPREPIKNDNIKDAYIYRNINIRNFKNCLYPARKCLRVQN